MTRAQEPLVTICDITVKSMSSKALLIVDCDGSEYWIPKSHIKPHNDGDGFQTSVETKGDKGDVVITEWIAKQKGLA